SITVRRHRSSLRELANDILVVAIEQNVGGTTAVSSHHFNLRMTRITQMPAMMQDKTGRVYAVFGYNLKKNRHRMQKQTDRLINQQRVRESNPCTSLERAVS